MHLITESKLNNLDKCVTEEIRLRAREELDETDEKRESCLRELKILLLGETSLIPNTSDEFLLQFLRAKKFKTQAAFKLIKNYYSHRASYLSLYQNYSPKQNLKVLRTNLLTFLPWRTEEDSAIWVARVGSWDPRDFDFEQYLRFGILCHEKVLRNPVTQICGIVSVVDLQGFSWSHLLHIPPSMVKCFVSLAQDCLPIRHKAIHVINNSSLFGFLFDLMKPFISPKIRNRIHFHGYSLSSLHQYLHPSYLPKEYGGTRGPVDPKQFYDSLLQSEEDFVEHQSFGYKIS